MKSTSPVTTNSKILIVGSSLHDSLENMYLRAFRKCGFENINLLDINATVRFMSSSRLMNRMTRQIRYHAAGARLREHLRNNNYAIIIVFKGMQLSPAIITQCKTTCMNTIWVNINPDDPFNIDSPGSSNSNVLNSITLFDHYCIWSRRIGARLDAYGCSDVIYLPFGYDEDFHCLPQTPNNISKREPCISFVGSWDRERENLLSTLAHAGFQLRVFGNNWHRVSMKSGLNSFIVNKNIFGNELNKIVSGSLINLNMLRSQNTGSHNMRTFEIPAMGGLMLTNRTAEQNEFFPENKACYMYDSPTNLIEKLTYIFDQPAESECVRQGGIQASKPHSYTQRVKELVDSI